MRNKEIDLGHTPGETGVVSRELGYWGGASPPPDEPPDDVAYYHHQDDFDRLFR
jgi:hypothetical protein